MSTIQMKVVVGEEKGQEELVKIKLKKCTECGVEEGQLHVWGCMGERDPINPLGGYLITHLKKGKAQKCEDEKYVKIDEKKYERIVWLDYCEFLCPFCGEITPIPGFLVSNEEWKKIVPTFLQRRVICWRCYCRLYKAITGKCKSIAGVKFYGLQNKERREYQIQKYIGEAIEKYEFVELLAKELNLL